ncbi:unnamed protein product [Larinioides sclopetarius]|uniref:Uncharacterized protein n=1 Tax=Larinioides sclopetarius TaxID=280406 RepID=A0AAV2BKJ6_9ARAC
MVQVSLELLLRKICSLYKDQLILSAVKKFQIIHVLRNTRPFCVK